VDPFGYPLESSTRCSSSRPSISGSILASRRPPVALRSSQPALPAGQDTFRFWLSLGFSLLEYISTDSATDERINRRLAVAQADGHDVALTPDGAAAASFRLLDREPAGVLRACDQLAGGYSRT